MAGLPEGSASWGAGGSQQGKHISSGNSPDPSGVNPPLTFPAAFHAEAAAVPRRSGGRGERPAGPPPQGPQRPRDASRRGPADAPHGASGRAPP